MRFPLRIDAFLRKHAVFTLRCPSCGRPRKFKVIQHGTRLTVLGFPVLGFHKNYTAICTECGSRFHLKEDQVKALFVLREKLEKERRHHFFRWK